MVSLSRYLSHSTASESENNYLLRSAQFAYGGGGGRRNFPHVLLSSDSNSSTSLSADVFIELIEG